MTKVLSRGKFRFNSLVEEKSLVVAGNGDWSAFELFDEDGEEEKEEEEEEEEEEEAGDVLLVEFSQCITTKVRHKIAIIDTLRYIVICELTKTPRGLKW